MATLTYDYADQTAVLGPLAGTHEPHSYDLCDHHTQTLTVPRGWQVIRLQTHFDPAPPSGDDLVALVEAVREAAHTSPAEDSASQRPADGGRAPAGAGERTGRQPRRGPYQRPARDARPDWTVIPGES